MADGRWKLYLLVMHGHGHGEAEGFPRLTDLCAKSLDWLVCVCVVVSASVLVSVHEDRRMGGFGEYLLINQQGMERESPS